MRKTVIALAAATALVSIGTVGASATPVPPVHGPVPTANTQPADWHTGPRSDPRHSRGEERNEGREHHPSYGNNHGSHGFDRGNNRAAHDYNRGDSR